MEPFEEQTRNYKNLIRVIKPHPLFNHIPVKMPAGTKQLLKEDQERERKISPNEMRTAMRLKCFNDK